MTSLYLGRVPLIGNFNLDDFRMYNRVLSQAQINDLYNGNTYYNLPTINNKYSNNFLTISNDLPLTTTISPTLITGTNNYYYSFLTGTNNITIKKDILCDILVIGGGGSGACRHGGAGGAGALIYLKNQILTAGSYSIVIGAGGTAIVATALDGNNGSDTIITKSGTEIYKAKGGGGGGANVNIGLAGGSSGGGSANTDISNPPLTTNIPTGIYGNYGGKGSYNIWAGGGGGGAGTSANDPLNGSAGDGGNGRQINITGQSIYYAGGGGGGCVAGGIFGKGGIGGGGNGGESTNTAISGTANTGSGGGGSGFNGGSNGTSGAGGSGIVIIAINEQTSYQFEVVDDEQKIISHY